MICLFIWWETFVYYGKVASPFLMTYRIFLPFLVFLLYEIILLKIKKDVFRKIFAVIKVLSHIYFVFYIIFLQFLTWSFGEIDKELAPVQVPLSGYETALSSLTDRTYAIAHFPEKIPDGATNYYFRIENAFDGYNIHFLKFNIDKEYIENEIKKHKSKIRRQVNLSEPGTYILEQPLAKDIDRTKYEVYMLQNENGDTKYTAGFIASTECGEIVYFYANYLLTSEYYILE